MAAVAFDLSQAAGFFKAGGELHDAIRKGAMNGLYSAALKMVNTIKTQTIPAQVPQPTDRGIYKAGWKAERTPDGAMYYNPSPVAPIIEFGARAANVKVGRTMIDMLTEWVKRKGYADGAGARSMAWAIAHSMAAQYTSNGTQRTGRARGVFKGTGLRIMEKANKHLAATLKEEVEREVAAALTGGGGHHGGGHR